jgi:hypothetical protein
MCGYVTLQECIQGFSGEAWGKRRRRKKTHTHLDDLHADGRMVQKWIFKREYWRLWT